MTSLYQLIERLTDESFKATSKNRIERAPTVREWANLILTNPDREGVGFLIFEIKQRVKASSQWPNNQNSQLGNTPVRERLIPACRCLSELLLEAPYRLPQPPPSAEPLINGT